MKDVAAYSVLMSVYAKENPDYFRQAINSILDQSLSPAQIVLICDGPLPVKLEEAVQEAEHKIGDLLELVRLEQNAGLGRSLNEGLAKCKYDYIARMDTDDIARPERCERQLKYMKEKGLSLCSGWIAEFERIPGDMASVRRLPESNEALRIYAKRRNPMNHPAVMVRKDAIEQAGGYRAMPYFEDYDLWVRMIETGARLGNLQEVIVDMRSGKDMYRRRGGLAYCGYIRRFYRGLRDSGFISGLTYMESVLVRCGVSLLPNGLRGWLYRNALRRVPRTV